MRYKFVEDLTSDVMFKAYGNTLENLLQNAALAMFSVICDIRKIKPIKSVKIEFSADSQEDLLHRWLRELLTQSEINNMFFSKFKVNKIHEVPPTYRRSGVFKGEGVSLLPLIGEAWGEPISQEKSGTVVKGVTYYGFELKKTDKGYTAKVALDI